MVGLDLYKCAYSPMKFNIVLEVHKFMEISLFITKKYAFLKGYKTSDPLMKLLASLYTCFLQLNNLLPIVSTYKLELC